MDLEPEDRGFRQFDNTITTFMRERGIPGASIAVSKHGKPLFRKGIAFKPKYCTDFGSANADTFIPRTMFNNF